jgi:hypothetical protein
VYFFVLVGLIVPAQTLAKSKRARQAQDTVAVASPAEPAAARESAAFLFVKGRGVVRLDERGANVVLPTRAAVVDLRLDGQGGLWASLRDEGVVRVASGNAVPVAAESYEKIAAISASDAWAIGDGYGSLAHFDGRRWKTVRTRSIFTGPFDENRLVDIATDGKMLWVSSWNGLWRAHGGKWARIDPPAGASQGQEDEPAAGPPFPLSLFPSDKGLFACYLAGCFLWAESSWRSSPWPWERAHLQAVGASGLLAGVGADGRTVVISRLDNSGEFSTSETLPATGINDIAVDASDRVWAAVGSTLLLLDAKARTVGKWEPASDGGAVPEIVRVVIAGTGPASVPSR